MKCLKCVHLDSDARSLPCSECGGTKYFKEKEEPVEYPKELCRECAMKKHGHNTCGLFESYHLCHRRKYNT